MDNNLKQYIQTALWSSIDEDGESLDDRFSEADLSDEAKVRAENDWMSFLKQSGDLVEGLDLTDVAHDFWLTRNGHGAGFWDGDYEQELGKNLTKLAHTFSKVTLYVGNDGKLHFS